ncbi:hypothetical protein [Ekhidna sp. To15]|uniref:hypothetical protein n=1 Tax=Ekhidna sp. To15 TaxID=3395267 RepID=UPI003F5244D3
MKKLLFITAIAFATFLTSCNNDDEVSGGDLVESLDLDSEATLESNYEDIDVIVEAGLETINAAGRVNRDDVLDCATITHDEEAKTVTIDYGDGCEGPGGRTRAGIIRISYSDHRLIPGAFRTATFDGFSVDGVLVEGTRTIENISESLDDDPTFGITLTGGKLTFEDETEATRESERVRTWFRANNPLQDEVGVDGSANGTRRDGVSYTVEIISRIIYKRACWSSRVFIPVSGIKKYTTDDNEVIVDYGDGTCDNEVTITINGGDPITKVITPEGRR